MPFADEEIIERLEENIKHLPSVTTMLSEGKKPEQILETVLDGFEVTIQEKTETGFVCDCSHERVERSLRSLGEEDIADIVADGKPIEVKCQFCNKAYNYTVEELLKLRQQS
jgi:molecular chaperone Hsp33